MLEAREREMDRWELNLRQREQRLTGPAGEEFRRQQHEEGEELRRARRQLDAQVRELRWRSQTRSFSADTEALEQLDLQDEQMSLNMAEEPLEEPDLSDEELAQSELLGTMQGSAAQSEADLSSSAGTEKNLELGLAMLANLEMEQKETERTEDA